MAGPLDAQLQQFRRVCPEAVMTLLPDGTTLVTVTNVALPEGWTHKTTMVNFIVPTGYPIAKPDCFYVDAWIRLAGGGMPQNSGLNALPGTGESRLWFSWHVSAWNPTCDSLLTYFRVIQRRLAEVR